MTPRNRSREAVREADPAQAFRDDLNAIADAWDDLNDQLAAPAQGAGQRVSGTPSIGLVINMHVSTIIATVQADLGFILRVLADETTTLPPANATMPQKLRWVAMWRSEWLTRHQDLGQALQDDWRALQGRVDRAAYPTGERTIKVGIGCPDHTTDDLGQRLPCPGNLTARTTHNHTPDLICDHDPTHRITPVEWLNAARRAAYDPTRIRERLSRARA